MGILKIAEYATGFLNKGAEWMLGRQKKAERDEQRDAGRNEQKVADSEAAITRAKDANITREGVNGLSDDDLDGRLRKRQGDA